jgi:type IV fimbrial biogenesis protein FimT
MPLARLENAMLYHFLTTGPRRANQGGFTLVEMMTVVVIVGVMSALAVPSLRLMMARYDLYQATTSLHNRFLLSRSAAISRNTMLVANAPVVTVSGETQIPFTAPLPPETFPKNVGVLLFPAQPVGFNSRGLSTTPLATQTIQLQSATFPTMVYTISVSPSGKVNWCPVQVTPCVQSQ